MKQFVSVQLNHVVPGDVDVQPDVLVAASECLFLGRALPEIDKQHRFNCHVNISWNHVVELNGDELFHLDLPDCDATSPMAEQALWMMRHTTRP